MLAKIVYVILKIGREIIFSEEQFDFCNDFSTIQDEGFPKKDTMTDAIVIFNTCKHSDKVCYQELLHKRRLILKMELYCFPVS